MLAFIKACLLETLGDNTSKQTADKMMMATNNETCCGSSSTTTTTTILQNDPFNNNNNNNNNNNSDDDTVMMSIRSKMYDHDNPYMIRYRHVCCDQNGIIGGQQQKQDDDDGKLLSNGEYNQQNQQVMLHRLVEKAGNMEHAMMNMLHNAAYNLLHFNHLPKWLQDNDYLLCGHRPPMASFKACFWSIFRWHTETMNIWTHGIGCICFVCLSIYLFIGSSYATVPIIDKVMLGIFLTTAILCLAFSTCYHTLACHSQQVLNFVCKLDYCGISLLIAGSIVPCLYYAFYCSLSAKLFYSFITLALCAASVTVSFAEKFNECQYRPLRASVFTSYAFSSLIPAIHWFLVHSDQDVLHSSFQTAITCLFLMAILYICGALVYALRIPERFYPGKFDFYFHSHQLFHIFVIAAAICHLRGITSMADVRLFNQQQTCQTH